MKISRLCLLVLTLLLGTGCRLFKSDGSTISNFGAGSEAAFLNAIRGRFDAQITSDQARQYSRQRNQVSEEMRLELGEEGHGRRGGRESLTPVKRGGWQY